MNMYSRKINLLSVGLLSILLVCVVTLSPAQLTQPELRENFTKDELKSFVKANEKVVNIQTESEEKMITSIEASGLTVDRFNQIISSQQNPNKQTDASQQEMAAFNNAAQEIMTQRKESEIEMVQSIEKEGIDMETYNEIMYAYQQSPKIKKRISDLID